MPLGKIFDSIVHTTYNTPLVRLNKIISGRQVLGKCEFFNPLSSVKDRIGRYMIEIAELNGVVKPDTTIVEPTSGNTGISLSFVCAARGYRLILTMPESMSIERRLLLRALGAKVVLTPAADSMQGAIERAKAIVAETPGAWMPGQFENPINPAIHEATTGPEIWEDTKGRADILICGVGTGGTITGASRYLKKRKPGFQAIAVEPAESAVISGGKPGQHLIQGIGPGFIPQNLDMSLLDGVEKVTSDEAIEWARRAAREEGLLVGISSGAALCAAARAAARPENRGKLIVAILPSCGERYQSTALFQGLTS